MGSLFSRMFNPPNKTSPPRIHGETEPTYHLGCWDFFARVLASARLIDFGERTEADREFLASARTLGLMYCNETLYADLAALIEAALAFDRGECSSEELRAARDHFLSQCRLALGTND